ncbi:MAG: PHP domain-containing protein, partial [Planctomycetes bacterium]|nr:PHP domain-containing protein [Planctomycetota bacterium]
MASYCAPLALRSNFSLLTGTAPLESLVRRAGEFGLGAMALTDVDNLYGAVEFYTLARDAGVKPVLGAEITSRGGGAFLLARDLAGYSNLCRIITRRKLRRDFHLPECLAEFQEGLHVLTESTRLAGQLSTNMNKDRLWLLLASPGRAAARWRGICGRA